jgi:hypothetical protein
VLTGATADGKYKTANTCDGWFTSANVGNSAWGTIDVATSQWSYSLTTSCARAARLYCFEYDF